MADLFVVEQPGLPGAARVVLIHGSLDRSTAFLKVARLLRDLTVVRYDRRGYGKSIGAGPSGAFADQVGDLERVVADRPSILVGHSFGGVVALAFAAARPELARAVVAYESPMSWEPWWPSATAGSAATSDAADDADAAERFMRRLVGDERWEALPERTRLQRRAEGPALVAELRSIRPPAPVPYVAALVTVPVIAVHGSDSRGHHVETACALARMAPHAELHVVAGAGHGAHLTHPEALAGLVRLAVAAG